MVKYQALYELNLRSGKSLKKKIVGCVNKNDVIIVNQVKGRRARVVFPQNGEMVTAGWIALYTAKGVPLVKRL